jgi:hypothetical protein
MANYTRNQLRGRFSRTVQAVEGARQYGPIITTALPAPPENLPTPVKAASGKCNLAAFGCEALVEIAATLMVAPTKRSQLTLPC